MRPSRVWNASANELRDKAQAEPTLTSEQLVEDPQSVTVWFNSETYRLIGFDPEVQGAAAGPIDASPNVVRSRGYIEDKLSADLDGAMFDSVNLDDVGADKVPVSS